MTIEERAKKIKMLLLDVDGVLTDGRIIYDSRGHDSKFFDVHDGLGVHLLRKAGIKTILITAKGSRCIKPRAKDMQVEAVFGNIMPKTKVYDGIKDKYKLKDDDICFVGDDLVDLGIMKVVGLSIAVNNACQEIKDAAHYVTTHLGGRGAVREVAQIILKSQDKWQQALQEYQ